jgi:bifunctional DNA-binding transcriptional regulator/antitoxin component of YhaV-PrlF toxin-antitoxin module
VNQFERQKLRNLVPGFLAGVGQARIFLSPPSCIGLVMDYLRNGRRYLVSLAQSRITAQGQVSIPVGVMKQFGLAPGEIINWDNLDGHLVIEKAGQYTLEDVQKALRLPKGIHKTDEEIKEGIRARMRAKHAVR